MVNICTRVLVLFAAISMTMGLKQKVTQGRASQTPVKYSRPALDNLGLKWIGSFPGAKVKGLKGNQPLDLSDADLDFQRPIWIPFKHSTTGNVVKTKPRPPHPTHLGELGKNPRPFLQKYVPGMNHKVREAARSSRSHGRGGRLLLYFFEDDDEEEHEEEEDMTSPGTCSSDNCVTYRNKIYDMENHVHVYQLSIDIEDATQRYKEGIVWLQFLGYQREAADEIYEIFDQLLSFDYDGYLLF